MEKLIQHWPQTIDQLSVDPLHPFSLLVISLVKKNIKLFWRWALSNLAPQFNGYYRSLAPLQQAPLHLDLNEDLGDGIRPYYFITMIRQFDSFMQCSIPIGAADDLGRSIWSYTCSPEPPMVVDHHSPRALKTLLITAGDVLLYPPDLISVLVLSQLWSVDEISRLLQLLVFQGKKRTYTITQKDVDAITQIGESNMALGLNLFRRESMPWPRVPYAPQ
jgi:hypothetical protein